MKNIDLTTKTDEELAALARSGDTAAEGLLLHNFKGLVSSKASQYFILGADREDVVQEGMIGLVQAIRSYTADRGSSFRTFADLCIC